MIYAHKDVLFCEQIMCLSRRGILDMYFYYVHVRNGIKNMIKS